MLCSLNDIQNINTFDITRSFLLRMILKIRFKGIYLLILLKIDGQIISRLNI